MRESRQRMALSLSVVRCQLLVSVVSGHAMILMSSNQQLATDHGQLTHTPGSCLPQVT